VILSCRPEFSAVEFSVAHDLFLRRQHCFFLKREDTDLLKERVLSVGPLVCLF
jgi:hypothetical protein